MSETRLTDGGPAFPVERVEFADRIQYPGMSLRDWFAGQALAGLSNDILRIRVADLAGGIAGGMTEARAAYTLADAMLKARSAEVPSGEE